MTNVCVGVSGLAPRLGCGGHPCRLGTRLTEAKLQSPMMGKVTVFTAQRTDVQTVGRQRNSSPAKALSCTRYPSPRTQTGGLSCSSSPKVNLWFQCHFLCFLPICHFAYFLNFVAIFLALFEMSLRICLHISHHHVSAVYTLVWQMPICLNCRNICCDFSAANRLIPCTHIHWW